MWAPSGCAATPATCAPDQPHTRLPHRTLTRLIRVGQAPSTAGLDKVYEVGFHLRPPFWGRGIATEAATAVLSHAFRTLEVDAVFVGHNPKNDKSRRLLLKLGFRYTHDEFYQPTGLMHPSYLLAAADWPAAIAAIPKHAPPPAADPRAAAQAKAGLWRVTAGFFFTFAAYGAVESLLSSFHARLGYYSSAMVYYNLVIGSFFAPAVIGRLGPRLSMGLSALSYTACQCSCTLPPVFYFCLSCLC